MTKVGQAIFGTSARMSAQAIVPIKPSWVDSGAAHELAPPFEASGGEKRRRAGAHVLPRPMLDPCSSNISTSFGTFSAAPGRRRRRADDSQCLTLGTAGGGAGDHAADLGADQVKRSIR
jgi:hypothetical protein